ncbi:MAG: FKBP-type peptidyl-prolyl cis-trans isomerase [Desulfovibrio sp.]|uniref:FKBP-type peptidyl-prolyl cis-trans isomerase n=1 Tax=Desulfovibrio sp. 7SRBS1 TaxID=3378064 RepID=UPI003B3EBC3F
MAKAKKGDTVKVHYTGTLGDGSQFDSSQGRDPLEFVVGQGMVIPGFENAVDGLEVGESVSVAIPCADAYGEYNDELTGTIERDRLPDDLNPEVGMMLQLSAEDGQTLQVMVTEMDEETISVDGNHPLAGKDLNFDIELVEIA